MTTPTTDTDRLAEIKARLLDATDGPWRYEGQTLWGTDYLGRVKAEKPADRALIENAPGDLDWLYGLALDLQERLDTAEAAADDARAALEQAALQVQSLRSTGHKRIDPMLSTTPVTTVDEEIEDARVWWKAVEDRGMLRGALDRSHEGTLR